MVISVEQEMPRTRIEHLGGLSRLSFFPAEGKQANAMLKNDPKFGTIIYNANNVNTTFQPASRNTTPGLNNQLPPVAPIVPRGTK